MSITNTLFAHVEKAINHRPIGGKPLEGFDILTRSELVQKDRDTTRTPSPQPPPGGERQKRKVEWALETDDEDEDGHSDKQELRWE